VHVIGVIGPLTPPWWRSTYCSIPAIMGWLKEAITVVPVETSVAPGDGVTEASAMVFGAVELLQAASRTDVRIARPGSFTVPDILSSCRNSSSSLPPAGERFPGGA
jgi:hypothetical protein